MGPRRDVHSSRIETSGVATGESFRRPASTSSVKRAHCDLKRASTLALAFIMPLVGTYKISFGASFTSGAFRSRVRFRGTSISLHRVVFDVAKDAYIDLEKHLVAAVARE
jgi:hypothetical protein